MQLDKGTDYREVIALAREGEHDQKVKLQKSLQSIDHDQRVNKTVTGYASPSLTELQDGSATRVESLSDYLTVLAHTQSNLRTYFSCPTVSVDQVEHDFTRQVSNTKYAGNAVVSTETTPGSNSQYSIEKDSVTLGVYRLQGSVSDVTSLQRHLGNINHQSLLGTSLATTLLTEMTIDFWWAVRPKNVTGNNFYMDGIWAQHKRIGTGGKYTHKSIDDYYNSPEVVDLRGRALDKDDIVDITEQLRYNYSSNNIVAVAGPSTWSSFWKALTKDQQRYLVGPDTPQRAAGETIKTFFTSHGTVTIENDLFFDPTERHILFGDITNQEVVDNAPVINSVGTANVIAGTGDTSSKFETDDGGHRHWGVVAVNTNGRSKMVVLGGTGSDAAKASVNVAANGSVDLRFDVTTESSTPDYFEIYRTKKYTGAQTSVAASERFYRLFRVVVGDDVAKAATAGASTAYDGGTQQANLYVVRDRNRHIAGTAEMAFYDTNQAQDSLTMYKAVLQPMQAYQIARLGPSTPMFVSSIMSPVLRSYTRLIRVINAAAGDGIRRGVQ